MIYLYKIAIATVVAWVRRVMTTIITRTDIISPSYCTTSSSDHRGPCCSTVIYTIVTSSKTAGYHRAASKRKG